ncbi:MAG TPA: ATP-grasp fold amidoligase family protein [Acidimicrobiales bacterium]|nr:ATP-grasp fold amidoligase family protein [Acidimicrobiales bacterium]
MTFHQKLLRKMALDRRPLLTTFSDKVAVRDYVARVVGSQVLTRLYAVVTDPAALDLSTLPTQFVVKPSHASGMVWIVEDRDALDRRLLVATSRGWLATRYADVEQEWAYRRVQARIVIEELLLDADGHIPPDYKFFVFHGRACLVQVDTDRFGVRRRTLFRPDWTPVDARLTYPPAEPAPSRPDALDEMTRIAEALGQETDFVRVDLYDVDGRVVFGELTSYPGGARKVFTPESFDVELGRCCTTPRRYT